MRSELPQALSTFLWEAARKIRTSHVDFSDYLFFHELATDWSRAMSGLSTEPRSRGYDKGRCKVNVLPWSLFGVTLFQNSILLKSAL